MHSPQNLQRYIIAYWNAFVWTGPYLVCHLGYVHTLLFIIQHKPVACKLGAVSIRKTVLPGMAIPTLKIRRPNGRLIFNMGIAICRQDGLYIETGPCMLIDLKPKYETHKWLMKKFAREKFGNGVVVGWIIHSPGKILAWWSMDIYLHFWRALDTNVGNVSNRFFYKNSCNNHSKWKTTGDRLTKACDVIVFVNHKPKWTSVKCIFCYVWVQHFV